MRQSEARTVYTREQANAGENNQGQNRRHTGGGKKREYMTGSSSQKTRRERRSKQETLKQRIMTMRMFNVQIDQFILIHHK